MKNKYTVSRPTIEEARAACVKSAREQAAKLNGSRLEFQNGKVRVLAKGVCLEFVPKMG
jgi:hypothetical protein